MDSKYFQKPVPDKRYYVYIDIDDEKLLGNITNKEANPAIETYIASNYNRVINPLLSEISLTGKGKKYTKESAIKHVKDRLMTQYFI